MSKKSSKKSPQAPVSIDGGKQSPVTSAPPSKSSPAVAASAPAPAAPKKDIAPIPTPAPALKEPAATKALASPAPAREKSVTEVTFVLVSPTAHSVSVCGEFNTWSPNANPMQHLADGQWKAVVPLHPGRHQYKFVVDGQWISDPNAKETVPNQFGTLNSVVEVRL